MPRPPMKRRTAPPTNKRTLKKSKTTPQTTKANAFIGRGLKTLQEKKTIDLDPLTDAVAGGTAVLYLLNGVATGDDFTDRDGRRIFMTSLQAKFSFYVNSAAASAGGNFRVMFFYDKQPNGAAPVVTDVLKSAAALANMNLNNRSRFQLISNKVYAIGPVTTTAIGAQSCFTDDIYRKLNLDTQYLGTTNTIASIATGSLYMLYITDIVGVAVGTFKGSCRVRFLDY